LRVPATGFIALRIVPGGSLLSQWIALGGASYVVARGLNNIEDAKKSVSTPETLTATRFESEPSG
jgi:hypothetical protein